MERWPKIRIATVAIGAALFAAACTAAPSESAEGGGTSSPALSTPAPTPTPVSSISSGRILFTIESGEQGTSVPSYIDPNGVHQVVMPEDGTFAHAVWGPGDMIVFDSEQAGPRHLFSMSIYGGGVTQVTRGPKNQSNADMFPHGTRTVFESWDSQHDLGFFTVDVDAGGVPQPLLTLPDVSTTTSGSVGLTEAAYSPDGRWIAFTRLSGSDRSVSAIFVARTDGSDIRRLTQDALVASYPRWSPDGTTILFQQNIDEQGSPLWTVPFAGGKPRRLTTDQGSDGWAAEGDWSPDGRQIVFKYYETGWDHNELRIVDADGTAEETIWVSDPAHTAETPDWGP